MGDQILVPIIEILSNADEKKTNIQPTLLYNEGWMLRLVLDWLAKNPGIKCEELSVPKDCSWFSEALLPSPFLRGKTEREGYTHADGVVGKFCIGCLQTSESVSDDNCATGKFCPEPGTTGRNKGKLSLKPDCDFFYVVEAKMGSSLSSGTTNAGEYNQAARNIACIAELWIQQQLKKQPNLKIKDLKAEEVHKLGFYVLLPKGHRKRQDIELTLTKTEIIKKITKRIENIPEEEVNKSIYWLRENIDNFVAKIDIRAIAWETILETINNSSLNEFYEKCKIYNGINKS